MAKKKGRGALAAIAALLLLGGARREQGQQPEAQDFELLVGGTHGGALPHPKVPGDIWFFNSTFAYRGPEGIAIVYARVGRGGGLFPFNMEDLWEWHSSHLFVSRSEAFWGYGIGSTFPTQKVPDVPEGTYDAEAEVWYFPMTLEQAQIDQQRIDAGQGSVLPDTLAGARASSTGVFLARDNDQNVYKVVSVSSLADAFAS